MDIPQRNMCENFAETIAFLLKLWYNKYICYSDKYFSERFDNMNNNMEIQREAIIEIVGTQYEGRAVNHQNLIYQQNLKVKHQSDNIHDHNAIIVLTNEDKELGFLPKGYASLYAPAIDSGRYSFAVEIVRSEPDPERPILIVKITSELKNHSEEDIERDILAFIQNIVNGYAQERTEYLKYIYAETVNVDELLSALNKVRLIQKLHSSSTDIIKSHSIAHTSEKYTPLTKDALTKHLNDSKADVNDVLKKIQKAYNESLDIDDEEEYHRVQSEIRERRKKFRLYNELLISLIDTVESYTDISVTQATKSEVHFSESTESSQETIEVLPSTEPETHEPESIIKPEHEVAIPEEAILTEKAFFDWLISDGGVSDTTAKQYISNIHSIEKLYQTLFGVRKNLLGVNSADNAKTMIEILLQRSEYIDANDRRHNSFSASLNKFAQFACISVERLKSPTEKKNYQPPICSDPFIIKTVDFNNPHNCTHYKPCSFILNELKYSVGSWRELYTKFLVLLYNNNNYAEILKGLIGKSLYGHRTDFADKTLVHELRRAIRISSNFFAEGNLSAIGIIKRVKCLMELCSIDDNNMIIEYNTQNITSDTVLGNNDNMNADVGSYLLITEQSFEKWLTISGNIAETTIKGYIRSIHYIEELFRSMLGIDNPLFGNIDKNVTESLIKTLIHKKEYIQDNQIKHHRSSAALAKYIQFTGLVIDDSADALNAVEPYTGFDGAVDTISGNKKGVPYDFCNHSISEEPKIETTIITHDHDLSEASSKNIVFSPDTSNHFVLKDAVIEILSSNAPEITKYHEHKDGISSKNLRELIKAYYGKTIGLFEISKLLMLDKTFQSVGKGCYIVNEAAIPHSEPEPEFTENDEPVEIVAKPVCTPEPIIAHKVPTIAELVKTMTEPISTATQPAIHEETMADDTVDIETNDILTIEPIIAVIKENYDNLQYEDGFGAYEVKTLLSQKGYTNASEDEIEALMTECSELQEIEDGYYTLAEVEDDNETSVEVSAIAKDNTEDTKTEVVEAPITVIIPEEPQEVAADTRYIVLRLNGNVIRAYDYSDALNKVCEFCINCKPFRMARIAGQAIRLHGNNVFYRKSVPVDGYNKLSNGLQLITIDSLSNLQAITVAVQKYCQIDDDMIAIISQ